MLRGLSALAGSTKIKNVRDQKGCSGSTPPTKPGRANLLVGAAGLVGMLLVVFVEVTGSNPGTCSVFSVVK